MRCFRVWSVGIALSALTVGCLGPSPIKVEKSLAQSKHHCDLRSEVDPKAEIQWSYDSTNAPYWRGRLSYGGKTMLQLTATQAQGYGSRLWWVTGQEAKEGRLIPFSEGQPNKSLDHRRQVNRFLLVGLGSTLYYRFRGSEQEPSLRMLNAAEGFWGITSGCKGFLLVNR
ncbi:MAG: hypothetical protein VYE46_08080 [Cyanobacteriota bacterium]|nr:hypothetical protein [Cyanobacteriota bacterium]